MAQQGDESEGKYIADVIRPLAEKIKALADNLPKDMAHEERARIFYELGNLYRIVGGQDDSFSKLRLAARYLQRARHCWKRAGVKTRQIARTTLTQAKTYCTLGEKSSGTKLLEISVEATSLALTVLTPERDFALWARCMITQASSLLLIGQRIDSHDHCEKNAAAADAVLKRPELKDFPQLHALALDATAVANSKLAQQEASLHRMELAVQAFRELAALWTKDASPLDWARTQMNLAISLLSLWQFDNRIERLQEAETACQLALKVYSSDCHPAYFGKTIRTMGDILFAQRQWKQAADLYLNALTVLTPETDEHEHDLCNESLQAAYANMLGGHLKIVVDQSQRRANGGLPGAQPGASV